MDVNRSHIRVVIVDDHAMLRKGLAVFLMSYADLDLVGEAANGKEALVLCSEKHPDIVLMDLLMPVMDGVTATRLIHQEFPAIKVVVLTSFGEERLIKDVLRAGAISYIFKKVLADDLAKCIRAAYAGIPTYAPEVTEILVRSIQHPSPLVEDLTPRENEVLGLIVKGMTNDEISKVLVISLATTKHHVSNILGKLGVTSRTEAIVKLLSENLNLGNFSVL
jgi:two-component system, NarL family, response regulator LiaR